MSGVFVVTLHQFYQESVNETTLVGVYTTLDAAKEVTASFLTTYRTHMLHQHEQQHITCYDCTLANEKKKCVKCDEILSNASILEDLFIHYPNVSSLSTLMWQHNYQSPNLRDVFDDGCYPAVTVQIIETQLDKHFVTPRDVSLTDGAYLNNSYAYNNPFYSLICSLYAQDKNGNNICNCATLAMVDIDKTCFSRETQFRWEQDWRYHYACHEINEINLYDKLKDVLKYCLYPYLMEMEIDGDDRTRSDLDDDDESDDEEDE